MDIEVAFPSADDVLEVAARRSAADPVSVLRLGAPEGVALRISPGAVGGGPVWFLSDAQGRAFELGGSGRVVVLGAALYPLDADSAVVAVRARLTNDPREFILGLTRPLGLRLGAGGAARAVLSLEGRVPGDALTNLPDHAGGPAELGEAGAVLEFGEGFYDPRIPPRAWEGAAQVGLRVLGVGRARGVDQRAAVVVGLRGLLPGGLPERACEDRTSVQPTSAVRRGAVVKAPPRDEEPGLAQNIYVAALMLLLVLVLVVSRMR